MYKKITDIFNYWWIIILALILFISSWLVFQGNQEHIAKLEKFGELFSLLITPVCIVLGLILGYPLLKRKLLDNYISRQFEIIYNANRKVRNQSLKLRDKYSPDMISRALTREDLLEALHDMKILNELAIDASESVY